MSGKKSYYITELMIMFNTIQKKTNTHNETCLLKNNINFQIGKEGPSFSNLQVQCSAASVSIM
jgi:hypothetical protein